MRNATRDGIVLGMLRVVSGFVLATIVAGCLDASPDHQLHPSDSGVRPPFDAAVVSDLEARFLAVADTYADERCRCAGDLAVCRREQRADWDEGGRACLRSVIELDPTGFEAATACLEGARDAFVTCHVPLSCDAIDARTDCADAFSDQGGSCLRMLGQNADVALATCMPKTPDAGP